MDIASDTQELIREAEAADPSERMYALSAMAMSDTPEVRDRLIAGLKDQDRDCRAASARLLGDRRDPEAVPALADALIDSSSDITREAADALGSTGDHRAVRPLMLVLREYSAPARAAAARALGGLQALEAAPALAEALGDSTEGVRAEAAEALGELQAEDTCPALVVALGDDSDRVRQSALSALRRLGMPAVNALVEELQAAPDERRWRAALALGECANPAATDPLVAALSDESENVRAQAALALGSMGGSDAAEPLREARNDPAPSVREAAALSLARLGEPSTMSDAMGGDTMTADRPPEPTSRAPMQPARMPPRTIRPGADRRQTNWTSIVVGAALIILVGVVVLWALWQGGVLGSREDPSDPSTGPIGATPPDPVTPVDAESSDAECQVVSPRWFIEGDTLYISGQVVNSGTGPARDVEVHVTITDEYDEIVARQDTPTEPATIRADFSAEFTVKMDIPDISGPPGIAAAVEWR